MSITEALPNLPPPIARHTLYLLTEALPEPLSDLPEERAARDESAIAALAALQPANAFEAHLARRVITADAHAIDALCSAAVPGQTRDEVHRCRSQAASMMRGSQNALRTLQAIQASRLRAATIQQPAAAPPAAEPPPNDISAQADEYALLRRKRAAIIRRLGRLPDRLDYGPVPPDLVRAIVTGTSPILRSLDRPTRDKLPLAA